MTVSKSTIAATRFGYGFHPGRKAPADAAALLDELGGPPDMAETVNGLDRSMRALLHQELRRARKAAKSAGVAPAMDATYKAAAKALRRQIHRDAAARLTAPVISERGFHERLVWFWADHFTVSGRKKRNALLVPAFEAEAIRPNVARTFPEMLRASSTHPAMLAYLDQFKSVGPDSRAGRANGKGLNENLAREIIELHTLGVGAGYSQEDVRQFAELLTGLTLRMDEFETDFRPRLAEPGAETVLGRSYGGRRARVEDIHAALDDLALRPETANHIARKLAVHFVADEPDEGLVAQIAAAYTRSDGDLMTVYEAMLAHPASWAPEGRKVKQPFDYVVSSLRAAGFEREDMPALIRRGASPNVLAELREMNQQIYGAPGPNGWPEEAGAWISPQGLAARLGWAAAFGRHVARRGDPRAFVEVALADRASRETVFAATRAAERWEGIALTLASPEFNRR
jgi:uncharacterized protein (DUF1800 family)